MSKEILVKFIKPVGATTIPIWMGKLIGKVFWCYEKDLDSWALSKRGIEKMTDLLDGTGADAIFYVLIHETCGEEVEQPKTISLSEEILLLSLESQLALAKIEVNILKENQRGASTIVYDTMVEVANAKLNEINRQILKLKG